MPSFAPRFIFVLSRLHKQPIIASKWAKEVKVKAKETPKAKPMPEKAPMLLKEAKKAVKARAARANKMARDGGLDHYIIPTLATWTSLPSAVWPSTSSPTPSGISSSSSLLCACLVLVHEQDACLECDYSCHAANDSGSATSFAAGMDCSMTTELALMKKTFCIDSLAAVL